MDQIKIKELEIFANHGVFQAETDLGQKFVVSAVLYLDTRQAGRSDDLSKSVHYGEVSQFMTAFMQEHTVALLETAAEQLAQAVLLQWPLLKGICLEIQKPWAPVHLPLKTVAVEITRSWHQTAIALGSNMGDSRAILDHAVETLRGIRSCRNLQVSDYIVTAPYGGVEQDDFLNGALIMETLLDPEELLETLHEIEAKAGRERVIHWGPRTLDLDILLYDQLCYDSPDLHIPHIEMEKRAFVLKPLAQIAPWMRHPGNGRLVSQMEGDLHD